MNVKKKITIINKKTNNIYAIIFIEGKKQEILSKNIVFKIRTIKISNTA